MRKISKLPFRILVSSDCGSRKQRADDLLSLGREFAVA